MNNPVNRFVSRINNHIDYDLSFIVSCIDDVKLEIERSLADIDMHMIKELMEAMGYQILDVTPQHTIIEKNKKRLVLLYGNDLDESIDTSMVVKVNGANIRILIFEFMLDYLCGKYDVFTFNTSLYQYIRGVIYHNN